MKRIVSLIMTVVMLLGCLSALTACGAPEDAGAEISVYLGNQVLDFDPSDYYADSTADQVMSLLFEPLFSIDEDGDIKCAAAKKYDVDEDERTITVELRETYWSDDVRVKAADFVYAWCERILEPNIPNPAAPLFYDIENAASVKSGNGTVADVGVVASEVYELTITYREGADYKQLLRNLASVAASPVRQDIVQTTPTYWSKQINTMVFNGPFKIRTFDVGSGAFALGRNLGYHQDPTVKDYDNKVGPAELSARLTISGEEIPVSYSDLENKTVFYMTDAPLSDRAAYKKKADVYDDTSVYTYVFNTENPLFSDYRVRRALTLAVDRQAIINAVTFGVAADGFLPDISGGSDETLISTNMAEAQRLIAEADLTGVSKRFSIKVADNEQSLAIAELVKASWEQLGFTVTVIPVGNVVKTLGDISITDSGMQVLVKEAAYGNRSFDVIGIDWQLYSTDAFVGLAAFSTTIGGGGVDFVNNSARTNITGWSSANYDSIINNAFKAKGDKREELLLAAEKYLMEQCPVCPIMFNQTFAFEGKGISGVKCDGFGNLVFTKARQANYKKYLSDDE